MVQALRAARGRTDPAQAAANSRRPERGGATPLRRPAPARVIRFTIPLVVGMTMWSVPTWSEVTVGGPFTLTASDGTPVTDRTYRGHWLLVYFGYTSCPDTCPTALVTIAAALARLGPDAALLQPLFITVDPQRDTADVLKDYTRSFDPRIVGLTGSERQIEAVADEYGAYVLRRSTGPEVDDSVLAHSP